MDRIKFIATLAGGLLTAPRAAVAQPAGRTWRVGLAGGASLPAAYGNAFRTGLGELGFIVGQNVSIEYRPLGDRLSPTPELVADFVRDNVDVIGVGFISCPAH